MSFLSCIGKKSKKKKTRKNEPLDRRLSEKSDVIKEAAEELKELKDETASNKSAASQKSASSHKSTSSASKRKDKPVLEDMHAENERLRAELDALTIESNMFKTQLNQHDDSMLSQKEEMRGFEHANTDLQTRVTVAEADSARLCIENQKLLQKIVGMEENQAMMSRAELHSMIAQLEEAELKSSSKPATELSGIRTNPAEIMSRKKVTLTQEDRQLSWRLSKTEARLSQSEDENKRLREDLKEMLDSNTELQQIIVSDDTHVCQENPINSLAMFSEARNRRSVSVSTATDSDDSDADTSPTTLQTRLWNAEKDQIRLQKEYDHLENSFEELLARLDLCEENNIRKIENAQIENDKIESETSESDFLQKNLQELEKEQLELRADMKIVEDICNQLNERIDTLYIENSQIKAANDKLMRENKEAKNETEKRVKEVESLRNEMNVCKDENKRLSDEVKKYTQLQKKKDTGSKHIEQDLSDMRQKYEEANRRLKELTTSKPVQQTKSLDLNLTTPTTLAERFRNELYEIHWIQAFEKLTKKMRKEEKKTIQILGEICTEAYLFCKRAARNQMETVTSSLLSPTANQYRSNQMSKRNGNTRSSQDHLPEDLKRRLIHYRCRPNQEMLKTGVNDFLNQIDYDRTRFLRHVSERDFSEIMTYVSMCFEIVWCMSVQDPPMYLLFKVKHGLEIDTDKFDRCQSRGKRADFVIWPAVLSEEGGACLQRGVMQTLPERA